MGHYRLFKVLYLEKWAYLAAASAAAIVSTIAAAAAVSAAFGLRFCWLCFRALATGFSVTG